MTVARKRIFELLQKETKFTEDEFFEIHNLMGDLVDKDENTVLAARAALAQLWVDGMLPYQP